MKKKLLSLVLTLSLAMGLIVPSALALDSDDIEVDDSTISVGETTYAEVLDYPDDLYYFDWEVMSKSTGDADIETDGDYDEEAEITGESAGKVYIKVTAYDEEEDAIDYTTFSITVEESELTSVSVSPSSVHLDEGDTKTLTATIDDDCDEDDVYFEWYSKDEDVAYISGDDSGYGLDSVTIKADSYDTVRIYCEATYYDDDITVTDYCTVYVDGETSDTLDDVDIGSDISLDVGGTKTIKATVSDDCDRDDVTFTWSSSNTSVATLDTSGGTGEYSVTVTGKSTGTATITCKAKYDGETVTDTLKVTVGGGSSFAVSSDLPATCTTTQGSSNILSFTLTNNTGYTAYCLWYVDGEMDSSSSTSSFNTQNLSAGSHSVYCQAITSDGSNVAKTGTCTVTVDPSSTSAINNFKTQYTYSSQFTDVSSSEWYAHYVQTAYEYGLVNGKNTTETYCPDEYFTIAEALKIAACIHSIYNTGSATALTEATSSPEWYTVYVDYCVDNGIVNGVDFPDVTQNCTRAQMAYIFSRCLPSSELTALREVTIPDCDNSTQYLSNIQTLFNAGIVSGDESHNYNPGNFIKRSEVAKIVCTLVVPSTRDQNEF